MDVLAEDETVVWGPRIDDLDEHGTTGSAPRIERDTEDAGGVAHLRLPTVHRHLADRETGKVEHGLRCRSGRERQPRPALDACLAGVWEPHLQVVVEHIDRVVVPAHRRGGPRDDRRRLRTKVDPRGLPWSRGACAGDQESRPGQTSGPR